MKGPEQEEFLADINMTPFVDIVLVLLVIFMLSVPLLESRFDVDLPEASTKENGGVPTDFEVCVISKTGAIEFLRKKFDSLDEFKAFLKDKKLAQKIPIFIRADDKTQYGVVAQVLSEFKNKGVQQVSLVTRHGS